MENFTDTHYFPLPFQGNLYTMVNLEIRNSPNKLLVASLKRDIFYIEFQESSLGLIPTAKEVSFTYIPSGAEIISMDAFNKSNTKNEFVIGVAIVKNNNNLDSWEFYLNIYSEWEENDDFNIENIAQNCLNVELTFTPYQLIHSNLIIWKNNEIVTMEIVFLLSGSDNQIHIYREHTSDHLYKEIENREYFPEFLKTPSPVVYIDIYYNDDLTERITAIGCECGFVRLTKVCVKTCKLLFNFTTKLNNFISSVKLYKEYEKPKISKDLLKGIEYKNEIPKNQPINLLVINTILPPILFEDIINYGLSKCLTLPRRDLTSVLSCCQIADVDFDGRKEILIGSNAEEIILYKFNELKDCWCLKEIKLFASPILNMKYIDVIGDGLKELIVMCTKGINFLQYDFDFVENVLNNKIKKITIHHS